MDLDPPCEIMSIHFVAVLHPSSARESCHFPRWQIDGSQKSSEDRREFITIPLMHPLENPHRRISEQGIGSEFGIDDI